jgi:hypothetical protein
MAEPVSSPLVSIVIPVGSSLTEFSNLDSTLTLNKGLENVEFILVLDNVNPEFSEAIRKLLRTIDLINAKCLVVNFGNPGQTRNAGLAACKGTWVQFWDSDDIGDLRATLNILKTEKADVVVQQFRKRYANKSNEYTSETHTLFQLAINPGIWRIAIKRSFLKEIEFPALSMAEDQVFIFKLVAMSPTITFISSVGYTYFVGVNTQLTSQHQKMKDLPRSMSCISEEKLKDSRSIRCLQLLFLEKLLLTSIKRSDPLTTLQSLSVFLRFTGKNLSKEFFIDFVSLNAKLVLKRAR